MKYIDTSIFIRYVINVKQYLGNFLSKSLELISNKILNFVIQRIFFFNKSLLDKNPIILKSQKLRDKHAYYLRSLLIQIHSANKEV